MIPIKALADFTRESGQSTAHRKSQATSIRRFVIEHLCNGNKIVCPTFPRHIKRAHQEFNTMLGTILLIILILLLIGALPNWGYSRGWGYGPSGGLGLVVVIILILLLLGRI